VNSRSDSQRLRHAEAGSPGCFEDGESTVLLGEEVADGQAGLAAAYHDDFAPLGAGVSDDRHAVGAFRSGGGLPAGTGPLWVFFVHRGR
jgi:hypothetical protein